MRPTSDRKAQPRSRRQQQQPLRSNNTTKAPSTLQKGGRNTPHNVWSRREGGIKGGQTGTGRDGGVPNTRLNTLGPSPKVLWQTSRAVSGSGVY